MEQSSGAAQAEVEDARAELVTFHVKAACIYTPLPPATSYGHRAELWDVDNYFREVRVRVVSCGDQLYVRLEDLESGELFAECPLPSDGSALTRAVEPVVDSSRYYVLRVVDREDEKKHAFLGLGFRERHESSAFSSALDEYRQYLRRKREAEAMRAAHEQQQGQGEAAGEAGAAAGDSFTSSSSSSQGRFALPAGQTISLKIPGSQKFGGAPAEPSPGSRQLQRVFSLNESIAGVRLPPPPPSPGMGVAPRRVSGAPEATQGCDWAAFSEALPEAGTGGVIQVPSQQGVEGVQGAAGGTSHRRVSGEVVRRKDAEEEAWGDFQ